MLFVDIRVHYVLAYVETFIFEMYMSTDKPLFNHDFGLSQLGGNQALLDKMLGKFVDEFKDSVELIKNAVAEERYSDAKIKVHTTKGISGNLGLQALYACATELDAELRNEDCPEPLLNVYEEVLSATINHILSNTDNTNEPVEMVETDITQSDGKQTLLTKLERNEFIDDDMLVELVSSLRLDNEKAQLLIKYIEELNYPDAIALVNQ
jgi:HPt (histidine-containing phosphotransfer) domain-containing protein